MDISPGMPGNKQSFFFDSTGFRNREDGSIDISTMNKGFGRAPSDTNASNAKTKFTDWTVNRDNSESYFNQTLVRSGVFEDNFRCTNYELALEFGKDPASFIEPTSKAMQAIYIFPKDPPIQLTPNFNMTPIERKDLPLVGVSEPGSFASKRKWDQKGSLRIANQTSIRFGHDSYVNKKRLNSMDFAAPVTLPETERNFHRPVSHIFPGLKSPVKAKYVN